MLIVKTEAGLKYFKDLFQRKSLADTIEQKEWVPLKKFYRAQSLLTSQGKKFIDSISLPHIIQELVIPKVPHYEPKMWITKITKIAQSVEENMIDIEIEILTGRTHQIRYHLSKYGLPIVWDYLYMDKSDYKEEDSMHLQAYRLAFTDIDGEEIDIQCEKSW